jgi:hypothetical protein
VSKDSKKPESFFKKRPSAGDFYGIRKDQEQVEKDLDRKGILKDSSMKRDRSETCITIPDDYPDVIDFEMAKVAPEIDFSIVQNIEPWNLPKDDQIDVSPLSQSNGFAMWSGFGAIRLGADGCFYYSIGNHMYYKGNAYMMKYDPKAKEQSVCYELTEIIRWKDDEWSDGKIHGNPDMDSDGNMYVTSFSGPRPLAPDLDRVNYQGGHLLHHNIGTGETTDLGVPLAGDTWAYSAYNGDMNLLFAVGQAKGMVMVYDLDKKTLIYGGFPPPEIKWWMRCILMDSDTGKVYSTNVRNRETSKEMHFISWETRYNRFRELELQTPVNPVSGKSEPLRAHTPGKDKSGRYWCFDEFGFMYTFNPEKEEIEEIGINWGAEGKYTANLVMSPGGRYLYYLPGAHNKMYEYGTPLVQFDTKTRKKKVIAFLNDFYIAEYGYNPYGAYGIEIDEKGETVFFYTNGLFNTKAEGAGYGRPAIFHVHIPESERVE